MMAVMSIACFLSIQVLFVQYKTNQIYLDHISDTHQTLFTLSPVPNNLSNNYFSQVDDDIIQYLEESDYISCFDIRYAYSASVLENKAVPSYFLNPQLNSVTVFKGKLIDYENEPLMQYFSYDYYNLTVQAEQILAGSEIWPAVDNLVLVTLMTDQIDSLHLTKDSNYIFIGHCSFWNSSGIMENTISVYDFQTDNSAISDTLGKYMTNNTICKVPDEIISDIKRKIHTLDPDNTFPVNHKFMEYFSIIKPAKI